MDVITEVLEDTCRSVEDGVHIALELALEIATGESPPAMIFGRGRTDSTVPDRVSGNLPSPGDSFDTQKSFFLRKGFTVKEFVVSVVGGHSLGKFTSGGSVLNFTPTPHIFFISFAKNLVQKIDSGSNLEGHNTLQFDGSLLTDEESVSWLKYSAGETQSGSGEYESQLGADRLKYDFVAFLVKLSGLPGN